jgi:hypothetical protein
MQLLIVIIVSAYNSRGEEAGTWGVEEENHDSTKWRKDRSLMAGSFVGKK